MPSKAAKVLVPLGASLAFHAALGASMARLSGRRAFEPQVALQIAVVDKPPPPEPPKQVVPMKRVARAPKRDLPPPPRTIVPPAADPPPPTHEATDPSPMVITGITLESTSSSGTVAVGAGNTLRGTPSPTAVEPEVVKPYKAEKYAPSAQVTELPSLSNREALNLRKYYPAAAKRKGFEGDVVLRLLVDADGTVVKADVVNDPGEGLGPAAIQAALHELRFTPPKVNGVPVATTIPFTLHFTLD
jgi:protein TonB